jgi:hypothetical protein
MLLKGQKVRDYFSQEVSWIDENNISRRQEVDGDPWEFARVLKGRLITIYRNGEEIDWLDDGKSLRNS